MPASCVVSGYVQAEFAYCVVRMRGLLFLQTRKVKSVCLLCNAGVSVGKEKYSMALKKLHLAIIVKFFAPYSVIRQKKVEHLKAPDTRATIICSKITDKEQRAIEAS